MNRSAHARLVGVLAAALLVVAIGLAGPGLAVESHAAVDSASSAQQEAPAEFDFVEYRITVSADGTADWQFRYSLALPDESAIEEFEAFAAEFVEDETQFYENFRHQAEGLATEGTDATGREMTVGDFDRDAYVRDGIVGEDRGIVETSFTWTGFAPVVDGDVIMGDVFDDGLYLGADQRLVVAPGEGLAFDPDRVRPDPDAMTHDSIAESESLTWEGGDDGRLFRDQEPQVGFVPADEAGANGTPDDGDADDGADADDGTPAGLPWLYIIGALLVLGLLGGLTWFRRAGGPEGESGRTAATSGATGGAPAGAGAAGGPSISDEELLSDEDRVIALLEERGGRMKQVQIVEETEWSKSKVSMLLSEMEEAGHISKLRVGRENIVSLAGHEPTEGPGPGRNLDAGTDSNRSPDE